MFSTAEWLLVGAVAGVGVLHTMVPDHWVPITVIARQQRWSRGQTARAALLAGTGHVVSTLIIALIVWIAGVALAKTVGHWVSMITSAALVAFGAWIAISAWRDMRKGGDGHGHGHSHGHSHGHGHDHGAVGADGIHGPELEEIETPNGPLKLSIFESGIPPHFRVTGENLDRVVAETTRPDGAQQVFKFERRGAFWQSVDEIPEPHGFKVSILAGRGTRDDRFGATFSEHEHGAHDHEGHGHAHDRPKTGKRTALLLILGSSPMVEGIPAFFAAGRYGIPLILVMSLVFAATTIVTYVVLCVGSVMGLKRVSLGPLEAYGEVLSGAFIALVGIVFWVFPVL